MTVLRGVNEHPVVGTLGVHALLLRDVPAFRAVKMDEVAPVRIGRRRELDVRQIRDGLPTARSHGQPDRTSISSSSLVVRP